jgi:hypothetical protein
MESQDLLRFFVENGIKWVESQRNAHRLSARDLTKAERSALAPFFDTEVLKLAKIKMIPVIENPGFYSEIEDSKLPGILDFSFAAGITFKDTIVVSQQYLRHRSPPIPLIFHELVHVVQYQVLGIRDFIEHYVSGWTKNGFDYSAIPLEAEAYKLERQYKTNRKQGFSVIKEVLTSLGEES